MLVVGHRRRRRGVLRRRGASERERERGLENFAEGILGFSQSSAVFCFSHRWVLESSESVAGGGGGVASQSFEEFWTKKVEDRKVSERWSLPSRGRELSERTRRRRRRRRRRRNSETEGREK